MLNIFNRDYPRFYIDNHVQREKVNQEYNFIYLTSTHKREKNDTIKTVKQLVLYPFFWLIFQLHALFFLI